MRIKVLGCSGNYIGKHRSTAFLLNNSFLIDAGTVTEVLGHRALKKIERVLVSHTHIDHLKDLFPLVDELVMMGNYSIELVSVPRVLEIITDNLLNNLIWPDFTVIPSASNSILRLREIPLEEETVLDGIGVKPVLMTHTVYTVGFVVKEGERGFMFTADTGPTKRFWEVAREEKGIEFIIADVSFPDRLSGLATISGHMTPSMLLDHIDRYGLGDTLFYVTHIKPIFADEIIREIVSSGRQNIRILKQGETLTV